MQTEHFLIRDEINYGRTSVHELNGMRFVATPHAQNDLATTLMAVEEIPEFISDIPLRIAYGVYRELWIYPLRKEDIRPLGEMLSIASGRQVCAVAHARILARWDKGELTYGPVPLSTYYTNITPKEEEEVRF